MLSGKNIRTKGRCRKLDDQMYGPCTISSTGHNNRYCKLQLPASWKIHLIFNILLLEQYQEKNPGREGIEIEADDAGWKMYMTIASGSSNNDGEKHVHLVMWEGYLHEDNTWETFVNVNENANELLEEYYAENANMGKDKRFGKEKTGQKDARRAGKRE